MSSLALQRIQCTKGFTQNLHNYTQAIQNLRNDGDLKMKAPNKCGHNYMGFVKFKL